jgi:hypothetical protein
MAGVVPQRKLFARRLLHFFEVGNEKLLSAVATVSRQKRFYKAILPRTTFLFLSSSSSCAASWIMMLHQ